MWVSTYTFHHIVSDTVMHLISIKMQQLWCVSAMTARGGGGESLGSSYTPLCPSINDVMGDNGGCTISVYVCVCAFLYVRPEFHLGTQS